MQTRLKFTIYHGFAASLALHSALGLPFVVHGLAPPPEPPPTLIVELQGVVADSQAQQKVQQQTKGEETRDEAEPAKPKEAAAAAPEAVADDRPVTDDKDAPPAPVQPAQPSPQAADAKPGNAGASSNVQGVEERQNAQTLRDREAERERLREYIKLLTKKVEANLVYPDEGRNAGLQGTATVSFAVLPTGQVRPETVKIVVSSGQPRLDASAMKTIGASAPFDPPPRAMTIAIAVAFGRKR